jgi:aminotransferase
MGNLPDQFFAALVDKTEQRIRAGHDVINLGQGNPIDETPSHIIERLRDTAGEVRYHRYVPFSGITALKEAAARWYERRYGVRLDPAREIAVTIGVKVALQELSLITLNPGDAALVPDPGYPDYWSGIALAGGRRLSLPLRAEHAFQPVWEAAPDAALVFLNYPHNPTGQVAASETFLGAVAYARRTGALMVHDLAYGDILFDGRAGASFLTVPGARDVGVECVSLSKSYNMAGWRVGIVAGNADVIAALEQIQDHLHCSQFGAIQEAAVAALESPRAVTEAQARRYEERRDALIDGLRQAGWPVAPPAGGIFCWAQVPGGGDAVRFADYLLDAANVVVAPGVGFGTCGAGYVRLSLTAQADRLSEAARRIGDVLPAWLAGDARRERGVGAHQPN